MSEQQAKLYEALASAQAELPVIPKNRKAKAGSYTYAYADINDILSAVRETLSKHGLAISQGMDGQGHLVTRIMHAAGGEIHDGGVPVPANNDPQKFGSALTYMRRYGLSAMLGIAADEDVDGQGGEGEAPAQKVPDEFFKCQDTLMSAAGVASVVEAQNLSSSDAANSMAMLRAQVEAMPKLPDYAGLNRGLKAEIAALANELKAALTREKEAA